jgi:hypothetical protein
MGAVEGRLGSAVAGTFSGWALSGLGGRGVEEKMERHLANLVAGVDKENDQLADIRRGIGEGLV